MKVSSQYHAPATLPLANIPDTHWVWGWVGPRASLDDLEKWNIFPCWDSNLDHPAHCLATMLSPHVCKTTEKYNN